MNLLKFSAFINWAEQWASACLWQQEEDCFLPPAFQRYCISGRTVVQIHLWWKSAVTGEAAAGTSLAQCVRNHHTLNPMCLWHKKWYRILCLQEPSPCCAAVILQFLARSVATLWQKQFTVQSCIVPSAFVYQESSTRLLGTTLVGLCLQWEFFV